jgi:hypothetical protein
VRREEKIDLRPECRGGDTRRRMFLVLRVCGGGAGTSSRPDQWPTTVEDTVRDIVARMSTEDKEHVKTTKKEGLIQFHHGWGTSIRNYYGLWRGNERLILSACGRPCHPDDASMIIIEAVWQEPRK